MHGDRLRKLRMFENRVLKGRECSSSHFVRVIRVRLAGHVSRMGEMRGAHKVLVEKPEGRRQLGRSSFRGDSDMKMELQEAGWIGMDWSAMAEDRDRWRALVNTVMNLRAP